MRIHLLLASLLTLGALCGSHAQPPRRKPAPPPRKPAAKAEAPARSRIRALVRQAATETPEQAAATLARAETAAGKDRAARLLVAAEAQRRASELLRRGVYSPAVPLTEQALAIREPLVP